MSNPLQIRETLLGTLPDIKGYIDLLRDVILKPAVEVMNSKSLLFRYGLHEDQHIPTNQRNLTDVRTRMGTLLEYELAYVMQQFIEDSGITDVHVNYVIANKYPDLEIRGQDARLGLRFEVKALQTIAEEKSANFDTLIKDIKKGLDFVVILLWDWERAAHAENVKRPKIYDLFIFDAYHLAQMRDTYWLNRPPSNVGDGRQGFDLCFGVNCNQGAYNQEEGNYGKLMRIFDQGFEQHLPEEAREANTLREYFEFKDAVISAGLRAILEQAAHAASDSIEVLSPSLPLIFSAQIVGGRSLLLFGDDEMKPPKRMQADLSAYGQPTFVLGMNAKFNWKVYDAAWQVLATGKKPAKAAEWIKENLI